ncbi:uncharacterized protein LOC117893929 [Drosophila subobscura]|uniref:uncharacterized protein LOC117893929 n=1 Tax=Drosophila subobscura TaxID=7241 RepID=UPI00155A162A|nr:uncharacterized protein LOC117893929 [Drosophila subobscura]
MFTEADQSSNSRTAVLEKSSLTGAATNMKKLLKTIRRIFTQSKAGKDLRKIRHTCHSEEEHQNWLNEQLECSKISLH